ncbi:hypothetical protein [Arthrobacter sp. NPDC057013]|uniref:hypothetical protein n=1 Tax=Arthrobacter sp. NPDC057013 TaxID=3345999 RepID=UPI00363B1C6D
MTSRLMDHQLAHVHGVDYFPETVHVISIRVRRNDEVSPVPGIPVGDVFHDVFTDKGVTTAYSNNGVPSL